MSQKSILEKRLDFVQKLMDVMKSNLKKPVYLQKRILEYEISYFDAEHRLSPPLYVINYGNHVIIKNLEFALAPTAAEIKKFAKEADETQEQPEPIADYVTDCQQHLNDPVPLGSCAECYSLVYDSMKKEFEQNRNEKIKNRRCKQQQEAETKLMLEF